MPSLLMNCGRLVSTKGAVHATELLQGGSSWRSRVGVLHDRVWVATESPSVLRMDVTLPCVGDGSITFGPLSTCRTTVWG